LSLDLSVSRDIPLYDLHPAPDDLRGEVLSGLRRARRTLPCKYFYDAVGSRLFDAICDLDEYYVTRAERAILERDAAEIARGIGPGALLVELGSGSSTKTRIVLEALERPVGYVPVDISRDHLVAAAHRISRAFPGLPVHPVCADFTGGLSLPDGVDETAPRYVFFPGSTVGNFDAAGRRRLLEHVVELCGDAGGGLVIGIDLIKDRGRLEAAYNDSAGVTAAFNLNLLDRVNRELHADFDVTRFRHEAVFNEGKSRVEMYLVSEADQTARVEGHRFEFRRGERICTEHSYKFSVEGFSQQAARVGLERRGVWTDPEALFAVLLFEVRPTRG
jgi:dimethylhistidine N-methyltransferase